MRLLINPFLLSLIITFFSAHLLTAQVDHPLSNHEFVVAFGSCNKQDKPQPMWDAIERQKPDLWIWLGDNIYGDTENMDLLKKKYDQQKSNPAYADFRSKVPIYGIWDDHDYGVNDGDRTYPKKAESRELLFEFLDVPADNPARKHQGAYQSYLIDGGEGRKIKLILLDGRYFRDLLEADKQSKQRYLPNEEGDLLGEDQWVFLEQELRHSDADVHLIACGIQFIPTQHYYEKWSNFPKSRKRFFDLLSETKPKCPVLLSGDRHIAEVSATEVENYSHPIYEITASGMTHTWSNKKAEEANQFRQGKLVIDENYGLLRIRWGESPYMVAEIRNEKDELLSKTVLDAYRF